MGPSGAVRAPHCHSEVRPTGAPRYGSERGLRCAVCEHPLSSRKAPSPPEAGNGEDLRRALEVARLYIEAADRLIAELQRENERLRQISGLLVAQ
jgi:hypothetical protein